MPRLLGSGWDGGTSVSEYPEYHETGRLTIKGPLNDEDLAAARVLMAVWPMLGYLRDAPPRIHAAPKIAMSVRLWNALRRMRFEGINPVDPIGRKLYGFDVEPVSCRPLDQVEIVIPIAIDLGSERDR